MSDDLRRIPVLQRYLPPLIFAVVAAIGFGMISVVNSYEDNAARGRFEIVADDAADRIRERVQQHFALLVATESYFRANASEVSRASFAKFVDGLSLSENFRGIQGIGFARLIRPAQDAVIADELRVNYGIERKVWPETDADYRAAIVLLEPLDDRNRKALGFDMFSEDVRRAALRRAMDLNEIQATAPLELVQEITSEKQSGFLVYLPFESDDNGQIEGFVYSPFRGGDLHNAALNSRRQLPLVIRTVDTTGDGEVPLYQSPNFVEIAETSDFHVTRSLEIGGRMWTLSMHETPDFRTGPRNFYGFVVSLISVLLATTMALAARWLLLSAENAQKLRAISETQVKEKDLMLQEMKHRIKNSIARILAISRQTAATSESLDAYSEAFSARLQSMANAQDMLTRSSWQKADLHELLTQELGQSGGNLSDRWKIDGKPIMIDEQATQTLGLTFHELATNSLKYGAGSSPEGKVTVSWTEIGTGSKKKLQIDWVETGVGGITEPEENGFGTRLIDAGIRSELRGTISRDFNDDGLTVRMVIPLA